MSRNLAIIKLEELSSLLLSLDIHKGDDSAILDKASLIISDLLPVAVNWEEKSYLKLSAIIKDYTALLFSYYEEKCKVFDDADSLSAFDKKYDVRISPREIDFGYLELLLNIHILQSKCQNVNYYRLAKKTVSNAIGRFLLLHYGLLWSDKVDCNSCGLPRFYDIFCLALKVLSLYEWDIHEVVYLRLTVLNLLDVIGSKGQDVVKRAWVDMLENSKTDMYNLNEHACEVIMQCCDKFYTYHMADRIIEPLDPTWLYAYIYKQRFGYLYCKKITKSSSNSFYPYTLKTTAICFKNMLDRVTGNSPKVVLFEKGMVRRSSEYKPLESNFLFNYTSMKFE